MLGDFFFRLFFLSFLIVTSVVIIHAQDDQSGFISIDCGITEGSNYTDQITGILYSSDTDYVDTGVSMTVPGYRTDSVYVQQFSTLRSFPEGTRNCYNLRPSQGKNNKYLIRLWFLYGNYDSQNQPPVFDVHIGVEYWATISFDKESDLISWCEIIHIPTRDYINICFINTGGGTPFVSAIELRPLLDTIYKTVSGSLHLFDRWDFGLTPPDYFRYSVDRYDRMWMSSGVINTTTLSTLSDVVSNKFDVPSKVMNTAITPHNASESLRFNWSPNTTTSQYYIFIHFGEVELLKPNESRSFNLYLNENYWYGPLSPPYLLSHTIFSESPMTCGGNLPCQLRITRAENSTLPPLINALEVYELLQFSKPETDENDIEGIMKIKSAYNLTKNWQGDPCAPKEHVWDGVNCSFDISNSSQIISLDLSSSGLTGRISINISDLKNLQSLDLSNNSLTGQVPGFLSQMNSLRVLKLKGNNFTGSIPPELVDKSNKRLLSLSIDGLSNNTNPCQSPPCVRKASIKMVPVVLVVASVAAGLFVLLAIVFVFLWMVKRRKQRQDPALETKNKSFTYSDVLKITNNFERVIGQGGFGKVYHGYNGETEVAVKMLSPSSIQGYKEFQNEVSLLMTVHHKNLTPLVGYCNEGTNMGIIYEYMAKGNLEKHILDRNLHVIGWKERIQIAIDAAQGLEYLHHGCKPPIIHRDVKLSNILLNENFQARVADFGISRMFRIEGDTHVSTTPAGTPGYLDPEYHMSGRLTEKSDVYGFGIVLLEMVAGRSAIETSHDNTPIVQWVNSMLQNGDVKNVIDPRLKEEFDVDSVQKVVELARACASPTSSGRPTMNYVVMKLKECLPIEMANRTNSNDSVGY